MIGSEKKGLAIFGSTGTIGTNALAIVRAFPEKFEVISLAAGRNLAKVREQIREFHPKMVSVQDATLLGELKQEFPSLTCLAGQEGLQAGIDHAGVDVVVMGIVGFAALAPTLHAIRARKTVALANKESLVVAGSLLKKEVAKSGAICIPVDSEHNALFQLLEGRRREDIASIVLTASGGPLLKRPEVRLQDVTPELAVAHPNWKMGPKISVDSATLMNKGLELIEAHFLFDFPANDIEVWVHPQSIVHGAVWLTDNSCLAQLTKPDMRSSIGYAMGYPEKLPKVIEKLSLKDMSRLEFMEPDLVRFPALGLARQALSAGPSHLIALNAANEIAVESFLRGGLCFSKIPAVLAEALAEHRASRIENLETIFELDLEARALAKSLVSQIH